MTTMQLQEFNELARMVVGVIGGRVIKGRGHWR